MGRSFLDLGIAGSRSGPQRQVKPAPICSIEKLAPVTMVLPLVRLPELVTSMLAKGLNHSLRPARMSYPAPSWSAAALAVSGSSSWLLGAGVVVHQADTALEEPASCPAGDATRARRRRA